MVFADPIPSAVDESSLISAPDWPATSGGATDARQRAQGTGNDLVTIPLTGMPKLRSALVWLRSACEPKLRAFIRVAREVLANAGS